MPVTDAALTSLLREVADTETALAAEGDEQARRIRSRVSDSVARPLRQAAGPVPGGEEPEGGERNVAAAGRIGDRLWEVARTGTALRAQRAEVAELAEAAAALQDLAIGLADDGSDAGQVAELARMQRGLPADIRAMTNGPYLVTNARVLLDWLGQPLPVRPQLALCRCGESKIKPLCDGSHAAIGFTDGKDPARVSDRRDTYPGQQVTIYDNRGTCQHSGLCTDRLAGVFHHGQEPV